MLPVLTAGSIHRILAGEDDIGAVVQILGCKMISDDFSYHYELLISDGIHSCSVMLGTMLFSLVTNNEIQQFTIVRVNKYLCNEFDRRRIILLNLTILVPGPEVNERIGKPESSSTLTAALAGGPTEPALKNRLLYPSEKLNTLPVLTAGSINRILTGEEVVGAVVQLLACEKISGRLGDRYGLLMSDGVHCCPFVMLGTVLNALVTNNVLQKFTIVRVNKYVCDQSDHKVIILLNLTILVPGDEVNVKIGNPINSSILTAAPAEDTTEPALENQLLRLNVKHNTLPVLTAGSIDRIFAGEEVVGAVMQILACKKISGIFSDRYRLLISDGVHSSPYVMLGTQLNALVTNNELQKFTIVRVNKCVCDEVQPDQRLIILLNLTVLVPGAEVDEKIGNPYHIHSSTSSATAALSRSLQKMQLS